MGLSRRWSGGGRRLDILSLTAALALQTMFWWWSAIPVLDRFRRQMLCWDRRVEVLRVLVHKDGGELPNGMFDTNAKREVMSRCLMSKKSPACTQGIHPSLTTKTSSLWRDTRTSPPERHMIGNAFSISSLRR